MRADAMPSRPWPADAAASERVVVMCPQCGGRMFLSHTEPATNASGDIANFVCPDCGHALQQHIKPL